MKKLTTLLVFLLLNCDGIFASYSTDWIKQAGNYQKSGSMIARDRSNNLIVAGYIQANNIYTRKYDKFGNFIWEKTSTPGIASNYEKPVWVNTDKSNNVYVVGYRYVFSSSWEYPNAVVVLKYNASGILLWKQNITVSYVVGSSTGYAFNLRSEIDNNGNLFIGTAGTSPSGLILIKMNPAGVVLFNNTLNLGVTHQFNSMRLRGNKVVITGTTVAAWDTAGNLLWNKYSSGLSGHDVEIDGIGNTYVLTSGTNQVTPTSGADIVMYKLNLAGTQLWKRNYDFGGYDFPTRFTLVSNKLSVIGYGSNNSAYFDWITFQINTAGTKLWGARYNGTTANDEQPYFIAAKNNGEVFVTGKGGPLFTQSNGSSYLRMVTLKYDSSGVIQWGDTVNIYNGWGLACTLATDNSLFVMSGTNMTVYHFLDHTGTGSCGVPTNLNATNIIDTSTTFIWTPVAGAYLYHLRYKTLSAAAWTTVSTNLSTITIKTLTAGTNYEYAVEAVCGSGPSGFGSSQTFATTGTGYCTTGGQSTLTEYLSFVWIGGIQNVSASNNGYGDFTNLSTNITQGSTVNGYLSAYLTFGLTENYSIWIDYNHDNDFTDAGEQAVNISSTFLGYIAVNFTVPANATPGPTRMRVTMVYGTAPAPCGTYARGETEDYTVIITTPIANSATTRLGEDIKNDEFKIYPNPFSDQVFLQVSNMAMPVVISIYDLTGKLVYTFQVSDLKNTIDLSALKSGAYLAQILSNENLKTVKLIKY